MLVLGALTRLLGSSDDDWIERPMLPFCRKGHVAVRGHYDDEVHKNTMLYHCMMNTIS